jgi:hypothetical protein
LSFTSFSRKLFSWKHLHPSKQCSNPPSFTKPFHFYPCTCDYIYTVYFLLYVLHHVNFSILFLWCFTSSNLTQTNIVWVTTSTSTNYIQFVVNVCVRKMFNQFLLNSKRLYCNLEGKLQDIDVWLPRIILI